MNRKKIIMGVCIASMLFCASACTEKTPAISPTPEPGHNVPASSPTPEPGHNIVADCYNVKLEDYIKLGQYKNIIIETRDPAATDEEIEEFFESFLNKYAEKVKITDRTEVIKGDVVKMDYTGSVDGKTSSNMTDKDAELEIGSGKFIPGFEDSLIGAEIGKEVTFDITFPEDYWSAQMAGVKATFIVVINEIYQKNVPELTDELVAEKTKCSTVSEYREHIREQITKDNRDTIDKDFDSDVWTKVLENAEIISYPQEMLDDFKKVSEDSINEAAKNYNMSFEEYINANGYTKDEFYKELDKRAKSSIKEHLVLFALAENENIQITWEEYQELAKDYMKTLSADSLEELESKYSRDDLCCDMAFNKILKILTESADTVIKE